MTCLNPNANIDYSLKIYRGMVFKIFNNVFVHRKQSVSFAFTLAEVLITLGIIGVVAALTIPVLMNTYDKLQTVSKVKKAYSAMSQAIKLSEADNGPNTTWDWGDTTNDNVRTSFLKYFAPYLRIAQYCESYSDCGYSEAAPFYEPNGTSEGTNLVYRPMRTTVLLNDGSLLLVMAFHGASVPDHNIYIDINGPQKPNVLGKDVFLFYLYTNAFMPVAYDQGYPYVQSNCSASGVGETCAAKLMMDGWQMKSDYPW